MTEALDDLDRALGYVNWHTDWSVFGVVAELMAVRALNAEPEFDLTQHNCTPGIDAVGSWRLEPCVVQIKATASPWLSHRPPLRDDFLRFPGHRLLIGLGSRFGFGDTDLDGVTVWGNAELAANTPNADWEGLARQILGDRSDERPAPPLSAQSSQARRRRLKAAKHRYASDPEYRKHELDRAKRWHADPANRKRIQEQQHRANRKRSKSQPLKQERSLL